MPDGTHNEYAGTADKVVQASVIHTLHVHGPPGRTAVPSRVLPPVQAAFTDREPVLETIDEIVAAQRQAGQPALVMLTGLPGVGRQAVAVRWARDRAERFPDGRVYLDLSEPGSRDAESPSDLLGRLLRQLGVPEEEIPAGYGARRDLWLSRTEGRRVLVVLANVRMAEQVEPALPPSRDAVVLITTDRHIPAATARFGAQRVPVGELDAAAARELLARLVGEERMAAQQESVRALLELCGGWPLALRIAGGWLAERPGREIARAVRRLLAARGSGRDADEGWAMDAVSDGAFEALPERARSAYRLLGLHPVAADRPGLAQRAATVSFGAPAAAALLGTDEDTALDVLETLIDWRLLEEQGGRYFFHDRVRRHAYRQAQPLPEEEREAAVQRAVLWYLRASAAADLEVNFYRPTFGRWYESQRQSGARPFGTGKAARARALRWLETEHRNLCACVYAAADRGRHELAVELCEVQWGLQLSIRPYGALLPVLETGLRSARELGDPRWLFRLATMLGRGYFETARFDEAFPLLAAGESAARETDDPGNVATALEFTGRAHLDNGALAEATPYFRQAMQIEREIGRERGVAINLHHIARTSLGLGDAAEAIAACRDAYERFGRITDRDGEPDRYNQGRVATTLGTALLAAELSEDGLAELRRALEIMRTEGRGYQEARIAEMLADAVDPGERDHYLEQAIAAYEHIGSVRAAELRRGNPA